MVAAAVIGGTSLISTGASVISGNKAAKAQKNAAAASDATQRYMYDTTRADYAPYREVGYGALGKLAGMYGVTPTDASGKPTGVAGAAGVGYAGDGGYTASPGYQFQLDEGIKAAERSAAARGALASGGTMKAITRYAQGLASQDYDNYANRLAALAGVGQTATGSTAQAGQNAANNISQSQIAAGNAQASSYANTGAAISSGVNNLAQMYMMGGFGGGGSGGFGPGFLDN